MTGDLDKVKAFLDMKPDKINARGPKNVSKIRRPQTIFTVYNSNHFVLMPYICTFVAFFYSSGYIVGWLPTGDHF